MKERYDALMAGFERLSSREQSLLLLVVVLVLAGLVGFGSYFTSRSLAKQERRIERRVEQLREVAQLRSDYQARLREQQRLTSEVKNNRRTRLLSYLERVAKDVDVTMQDVEQRTDKPTGSPEVREEMAKVSIKAVSANRLDAFLRGVDQGNRLVVVRSVRITPNFENPKRLNATISVGTFKEGNK